MDTCYYFDANATTTLSPCALQKMNEVIGIGPLNASSMHGTGVEARKIMTKSRDQVCTLFGQVASEDLIFTSGGTEGNWIAINSFRQISGGPIYSSNIEHPSVLEPIKKLGNFNLVGVSQEGQIRIEEILEQLNLQEETPFVSIQWVNSETGIIQSIMEIANSIRSVREDTVIHVDAAQAVGRIRFEFDNLDLVTCSAHKLHGPHGIGALYLSNRAQQLLSGYFVGAGQEQNWRPGTENIPAIAGMAEAFRS